MGCWVDVLTGWWMEGARGQQEAELQSKGSKKYKKLNAKMAARVPSGIQKGSFLLPGGAWGLTLATPRGSLSPQGSIFEAQWSQKWVPPMGGRHLGTILELPGSIWGAILVSFWCRFGHLFCRFSH